MNKDGPVNPKTGTACWLWTRCTATGGYGNLKVNGKMVRAHRIAWELLRGQIPTDYVIDHDNPDYGCGQPLCVNPDHLEPVPQRINTLRRRGLHPSNTSGTRGVSYDNTHGCWLAQIQVNKKQYRKYCKTESDAIAAVAALHATHLAWV